ncbi:rhamnogalacturonan lyase [Asticcacaulis excentricus]|uniref:FG-GAP repeat protein n=1 Tax=Asticcacaulis excentricus (strain ATCC 15261 / DSM 4724 / KCTC 12464 / NCIMB 9791 / VKM B-1370 / CB 48) TaxID=573065 RepID=E8RPT6_ASTEC|nr:rhamnogalacturonan lyase [Asticcacaulis excentricus]ADU12063.1 FG-GAP repeat protein [Asticcacaulis excentricus CB 48]
MTIPTLKASLLAGVALMLGAAPAMAVDALKAKVEYLDRGAVAVTAEKGVLISWRVLVTDEAKLGFNVYRDGRKLNAKPITATTSFKDESGSNTASYEVLEVMGGKEGTTAKALRIDGFLSIPLNKPADGTTPDGQTYGYTANDASVGDLDGDGRYEVVLKWEPTNAKDNSQGGYTGPVLLDAYTLDGKQLWRINLGGNIRAGAHYTQFQVADYDGDGKAELIVKTADGTTDAQGKMIGDATADWVTPSGEIENKDRTGSRQTEDGKLMARLTGRVLKGPEYLSVFEGATGKVMDTIPYPSPRGPNGDNPTDAEATARWGDAYGNRSDRFLAGTAWLDGQHPSAIFARGYYARTTIAAVDYKNGKLTNRWYFDSEAAGVPSGYSGQGNHQFSVADVDGDGKQEILYGAMALDGTGKPLWTTGMGHGDAMHVSDLDPNRPGLEKWGVHENMKMSGNTGAALLDARTGEVIFKVPAEKDTGRGAAGDIDPRHPGAEFWASNSGNLYDVKGNVITDKRPRQMNFMVWWDGDLLRELLDGNKVFKWDWKTSESKEILDAQGATSNNGTKSTPALSADLFGDWREEVMLRSEDNTSLRIYSTNLPTTYKFTTLMQDPQYRAAIAWQNTAYNQPPWPSFFIGEGMKAPPKPQLSVTKAQ